MKKAIFFTIDALLASGIVILGILLVSNFYIVRQEEVNINYASQDLVKVFSLLKVGQLDNPFVANLTLSGVIENANNTVLEQIGEFWAEDKSELARNFTKNITEDIIPRNYGFSVLVNGEEIYKRDVPINRALVSSRKIISGIAKAKPTDGFTARVLLSGIKSKKTNAYVYFGGYEGDGNLTKKLVLPKDVISFNSSYLEVDAGGNFNLYINKIFSGSYAKGSAGGGNMLADKWNLSNAYLANFKPGENNITINFTSGSSYIAGGFLRVTYITSSYNDTSAAGYEKYFLPGIEGVINLYSSIYAPNEPSYMNISLHFLSQYQVYLTIGNTTVFESVPSGNEQTVLINNSNLSVALNYNSLSQKTTPLRLGLKSANITLPGKISDSALITDRTSSMSACDITVNCTAGLCDSGSSGGCHDRRDNVAIRADKKFIEEVLKVKESKVALVGFGTDAAPVCDFHEFTNDSASLKYRVSNYSSEWCGNTCISCGVQAATELLTENEALYGTIQKFSANTTRFHVGDSGSGVSASILLNASLNKSKIVKSRLTIFGDGLAVEDGYYSCVYFNGKYIGRMCEPHSDPGLHTCSFPIKSDWLNALGNSNLSYGLVGYWKLDDGSGTSAEDSSDYGNNGVVNGAAWASGKINSGLKFDGSNDFVNISRPPILNFGNKDFTYAAWINTSARGNNNRIIAQDDNSVNHRELGVSPPNGSVIFTCRDESNNLMRAYGLTKVNDSRWHHVVGVRRGQTAYVYIDGVLENYNTNAAVGSCDGITDTLIGGRPQTGTLFFNGTIDEARIYNRSLSSEEILDLYRSTNPEKLYVNNVTITGGTTSGCFQTSGDNNDWDFQEVKLVGWESSDVPSITYDSIAAEVQIGDSPFQRMSSSSLTINVEKSKMRSALIEFDAIDVNPSYFDCLFVNGNYVGSVDYQEWNGTNVWQRILFDVPVAWLKNGANEVNLTSGTTSGCHRTSGDNDEWRFRNLNLSVIWTDEASGYDRNKAMLVMSDGQANTKIGDLSSTGAGTQAVEKACEAKSAYGISIYTVLFGDTANQNAIDTLNDSACCDDCSHFYTASNSDELIEIYSQIAQSVGNITFQAQSVNLSSGNLIRSILYPDSYIAFNYTPLQAQFNKVPLSFETDRFNNNISSGTLTIYPNTSVSEAKVTSYSGAKWTDNLIVNGNNVYRLSDYGNDYLSLGDPFAVNVPVGSINTGGNTIIISTGVNSSVSSGGSNDSRVIYTLLLNGFADYSSVVAKSDGCSWAVSFEDGSTSTIKVPSAYNGADICSFSTQTYDSNDALDIAVFQLFSNLDLDKDGKLEVNIDANSLDINSLTVSKVPSLWGPAIVEIRVWE